MEIERIKTLNEVINKALILHAESKKGLATYADDSDADHGDGQQVGREANCIEIIKFCASSIVEGVSK